MTSFEKTWGEFKAIHALKALPKTVIQGGESELFYDIAFSDGPFVFYTRLVKGQAAAAEYEADWKPYINGGALP
jgi:hypothetical protein